MMTMITTMKGWCMPASHKKKKMQILTHHVGHKQVLHRQPNFRHPYLSSQQPQIDVTATVGFSL